MKNTLEKIEKASGQELTKIIRAIEKNVNIISCDITSFNDVKFEMDSILIEEFQEYYLENIDEDIEYDDLEEISDCFEEDLKKIGLNELKAYIGNMDNLNNFNRWAFSYADEQTILEWIDFNLEEFMRDYCLKKGLIE